MKIEIIKGSTYNPVAEFFSSSNTPETDAKASVGLENADRECVPVEFARRLERERDEARTTIEDAKRALNATDYEGILLAAMRVKEERDEAREKSERYRIEANAMMMQRDEWAAMCGRYKQERDEAIRQRNETNESSVFSCNFYYEEKLKAERERNEIQEKYDNLATEHMLAVNKLCEERDEAREQVKELIYIADRAIALADIDFENDKFGVVSELRSDLAKIKKSK